MFINRINGVSSNFNFKGYQHTYNDVGTEVLKFNYPYNSEEEDCFIEIYRVIRQDNYNYKIVEQPIKTIPLKPEGVEFDIQKETNLGKNEDFAYKVVRKDKQQNVIWEGADTGVKMVKRGDEYGFRIHQDPMKVSDKKITVKDSTGKDKELIYQYEKPSDFDGESISEYKYTLVKRNGTSPMVQGLGYLVMPDSYKPGTKYRGFYENNTGEIYTDPEYQKQMEKVDKTFSNMFGGSMAGLEDLVPRLKSQGVKLLFTTPIANGDDRSSHGYWNKNNMQIAPNMGNTENYDNLMEKEFSQGVIHVFDATLTSEGLEGIHFNYALRWGEKSQPYYWFRMTGLKDSSLGLGVIPKNSKNVSHRIVNFPFDIEKQSDGTYKLKPSNSYNSKAKTICQLYDNSQVSEKQKQELDKQIAKYDNIVNGTPLSINTHDDTIISYAFEINPKEYQKRIEIINELIKSGKKIDLYSHDGTILACQFSNFRADKKTEGGFVAWDANTDMAKMNYGISAYDEKLNQAIVNRAQRQYEQDMRIRGGFETRDLAYQVGTYWADKTKTAHTLYTARTIGRLKTAEGINDLIKEGKLPEEAYIKKDVLQNILHGNYNLAPKGVLSKDDATVKALMKLPMDTLEFDENVAGVLSTSYFSNRATTEDTLGMSRFDLLKRDNPHLVKDYAKVYNRVNEMFTKELNEFAQSVIKKVDESSDTKLIDADGNYTEYGEYVIELLGRDIAKYALLKSLAGEAFQSKILPDGKLTYDYEGIRKATSLQALGINAGGPEEEAELLQKKMLNGLKSLNENDIIEVAKAISKRIGGTDTETFRIAEAIINYAGLGLSFRLDALKDVMDIDAVWNMEDDFDDTWNNLIKFWAGWVQAVKAVNPHSTVIAELTNVGDIMKASNGGPDSCPYNGWTNKLGNLFNGDPDAQAKFFNETGITTEAAYSYFYTELLTAFSRDFEGCNRTSSTHDEFFNKIQLLMQTRSVDYLKNLYTFLGNHDKPRLLHGLAVDMQLFHGQYNYNIKWDDEKQKYNFDKNRDARLRTAAILTGVQDIKDIPLEAKLNIDGREYFRTVSNKAAAQTKLLSDSVREDLKGIASDEEIKLILDALIDLANGNFMGNEVSSKFTKINIEELSSLENAINEVVRTAKENYSLNISQADIDAIINKANNLDTNNYIVHGDFDWGRIHERIGEENRGYLREILGTDEHATEYSLYAVQIARMIKEAAKDSPDADKINYALKDFVKKFNRETISNNMDSFKMMEDAATTRIKDGYAAKDFNTALALAIAQAEYKSGKPIQNKKEIIDTVYKSITEPGMVKMSMIMTALAAVCGIPTVYYGDEVGMSGYEEKTKNVYLQDRNVYPHSELEDKDSKMGKLRNKYKNDIMSSLEAKRNEETVALRNGTPYMLEIQADGKTRDEVMQRLGQIWAIYGSKIYPEGSKERKELENEEKQLLLNKAKFAFMMQNADGNMTVSVFNSNGIFHDNRVNYLKEHGLNTEKDIVDFEKKNNVQINRDNPYIPIQERSELDAILLSAGIALPLGTCFMNANGKDKLEYIVEKVGDRLGIVRKDGKKIVMDGLTAKNGVMILKRFIPSFRGHSNAGFCNNKYYFCSNPYKKQELKEEGKKLSIISR